MDASGLWSDIAWTAAAAAVAAGLWGVAGFVLARVTGRNNIVDTIWGLGFVWTAAVSVGTSVVLDAGDDLRRVLLVVTVTVWGGRLSWYVGSRSAGKGDDQRYVDLLEGRRGSPTARAVAFIFVPQSLALLVVSSPLVVGSVEDGAVGVVGWLGVLVWAVGLAFEAVGDAQMKRFKSDPGNQGKIADVGLWSYTRHPNYFGDATVWVGIWLIAAGAWPGVLTVVAPVLMSGLLAFGTGARLLERTMSRRDGWDQYAYNTSGFVPMPRGMHRRLTRRHHRRGGEPG